MADRAQVTSVEAIETFRSALIVYLSKVKPTVEEPASEVARTRQWLENDRRSFWQNQMRLRRRELERAQGELFSARMSKIQDATSVQELALHKAQRAVREAEAKLQIIKKWQHELDNRSEPMVKLIEQLHGYLSTDMARAVVFLTEIIKTLQAYAQISTPSGGPIATPAEAETEESNTSTNEQGSPAQ